MYYVAFQDSPGASRTVYSVYSTYRLELGSFGGLPTARPCSGSGDIGLPDADIKGARGGVRVGDDDEPMQMTVEEKLTVTFHVRSSLIFTTRGKK